MITHLILTNEERTIIAAIRLYMDNDPSFIDRLLAALQDHYDTEEEIEIVMTTEPDEFGIYHMTILINCDDSKYDEVITVTPTCEY